MLKFKWSIAVPAGVLVFCVAWGIAEWRRYTVQNQLDAPSEIGFSDSGIADYADTVISHVIPPEMRIVNVIRVFQNMTYQKISEQITLLRRQERRQEEMLRLQQEQQEREAGVSDRQPYQDYQQVYPTSPTPPPSPTSPTPELMPMPVPLPSADPDNECSGAPESINGRTSTQCPEPQN
ncbi:MAG: hypothetical protein WBA43_19020 [Elainellaceae cyanobacterium]